MTYGIAHALSVLGLVLAALIMLVLLDPPDPPGAP